MNQEDLNQMINSESWIYDDLQLEGVSSEIGEWIDHKSSLVLSGTRSLLEQTEEYKELMVLYTCAMKTVRTKFDILNTEYNARLQRNPIKFITTRLKRTASLLEKMDRIGVEPSVSNIQDNIFDVAGIRVICSYQDDIYTIADALLAQKEITLIQRKDYIVHPKENGYRSLHLIVSVPVFFAGKYRPVKVEVQIRTIAMDYWASLEHQLRYKKQVENPTAIASQLKSCADMIHRVEEKMLSIRRQLEKGQDLPSSEDILSAALASLDINPDLLDIQ